MESLLPEADAPAQGEGDGGSVGSRWPPAHTLSAPSLVLGWELSCCGAGRLTGPHVIFQGKDPKIEEFVPPGQYRDAPWAGVRVWTEDASLGGWGCQRAESRVEGLTSAPPRCGLSPERSF